MTLNRTEHHYWQSLLKSLLLTRRPVIKLRRYETSFNHSYSEGENATFQNTISEITFYGYCSYWSDKNAIR